MLTSFHRPPLRRRCAPGLAPVAALALLLVACGSDGDNSAADDGPVDTAAAGPTPTVEVAPSSTETVTESTADASDVTETTEMSEVTQADATTTTNATTAPSQADSLPVPPGVEGKVITVLALSPWGLVDGLFALGAVPQVVLQTQGAAPAPDILFQTFPDEMAALEVYVENFFEPNFERISTLPGDIVFIPKYLEPLTPDGLLDAWDDAVFIDDSDWRVTLEQLVEVTGADPAVLETLDARYTARVEEARNATDLALGELTFSGWQTARDQGEAMPLNALGVQALTDLGLTPSPIMQPAEWAIVSLEELTLLDADLSFYRTTSQFGIEEIADQPVWATTQANQNGTLYPATSYWNFGGFHATFDVLDEIEAALLDYEARVAG
ncbi:MAG: hypothetical protein AAGA42_07250 [Actinomycetota bacterium]